MDSELELSRTQTIRKARLAAISDFASGHNRRWAASLNRLRNFCFGVKNERQAVNVGCPLFPASSTARCNTFCKLLALLYRALTGVVTDGFVTAIAASKEH